MRSFFQQLSLLLPFNRILPFLGTNITIPLYHLVADNPPLHVRYLYPVLSVKRFERDLDFFLKHFTPISGSELLELSNKTTKSLKPPVMFTFDDGFSEINDIVAPILTRKGVPANFFVSPAFIDNKDLMFRCKISLIVHHIKSIKNGSIQEIEKFLKEKDIKNYLDILKIDNEKNSLINELANYLGLNFTEYLKSNKPYLTTDQLLKLSKKGFSIGAHGFNHPYFKYLSVDEQLDEVKTSMNWLNQRIPNMPKFFAFPFTDDGVDEGLFRYLSNNHIVDFTFGTSGIRKSVYQNHLQRIPIESSNSNAKKIVGGEILYYLAKQSIGIKKI